MLTKEQVLGGVRARERGALELFDPRDAVRLAQFCTPEELKTLGFELVDVPPDLPAPTPWTREKVLAQAESDLAFAFEKALNKRGISADLMTGVIEMWGWILETPLPDRDENYAQYGLPILKAAALAWGFDNPIGDDTGSEFKYSEEADRG